MWSERGGWRVVACGSVVVAAAVLGGCYAVQWTAPRPGQPVGAAPAEVGAVFAGWPGANLRLPMESPGTAYPYDPGEKDRLHAVDAGALRFREVAVRLREAMPAGQVLADLVFTDGVGSEVRLGPVDLLRLTPRLDTRGPMQVPELLLEEFERTGVVFRREHGEFTLVAGPGLGVEHREALGRVYRVGVFNNCLDATKWELILTAEDLTDFGARVESDLYLDASKILSHSWFYLDRELYAALLGAKNPHLEVEPELAWDYPELAKQAQEAMIDFEALRRRGRRHAVEVLEVGHRSGRPLEPISAEQHYKWDLGLFLERERYPTYADLARGPVRVAQFADRGYYQPDNPRAFDYAWTAKLDQVEVFQVEQPDSDCYVEIVLDGEELPFRLTLGNVDLAQLDEQQLLIYGFGVNPYPKGRRHNPQQSTINYDPDVIPPRIMPYLFLTDKATGRWVNNIDQGVEMVYLGWESIEKNVMDIYLLSYERITPIWMGQVRLTDMSTDMIRVRRNLYTY